MIGNLLAGPANYEAAFATDFRGSRQLTSRALADEGIEPEIIPAARQATWCIPRRSRLPSPFQGC